VAIALAETQLKVVVPLEAVDSTYIARTVIATFTFCHRQ
jgi:hypothetical protein